MSSNDGRRSEDGFFNNHSPIGGVPPPLARLPPPQPTSGGNIPPPIMWSPPPLLNQQYIHHQQHSQPPPQQQYNEIFYNMHAQAFASSSVQPETYSVLPVGHGNFLKVYHRPEGTAAACSGSDAILYQQQFQQQQHQPTYHPGPQQSQPIYNSYELFSSNSLIPTAENTVAAAAASVNMPAQEVPLPPTLQMMGNNAEVHSTPVNSTTNKIINKLVNNWSPNLTGGSYAQFGAPIAPDSSPTPTVAINTNSNIQMDTPFANQMPIQQQLPLTVNPIANFQEAPFSNMVQFATQPQIQPSFVPQNQQASNADSPNHKPISQDISLPPAAEVSTSVSTNGTFKEQAVITPPPPSVSSVMPGVNQTQPEGSKKRIVAEVKPMRMTYSDVLSKFNNQHVTPPPTATTKSNTKKTPKQSGTPIAQAFIERKTENKRSADIIGTAVPRQTSSVDANVPPKGSSNKSPTHDKENVQESANGTKSNNKRPQNNTNSSSNNKSTQKTTQKLPTADAYQTDNKTTKKRSKKGADTDCNSDGSGKRYTNKSSSSTPTGSGKRFNGFYNVSAKNHNYETTAKATTKKSSDYQRWKKTPFYYTELTQESSLSMYRSARAWKPFKRGRMTCSSTSGAANNNTNRNYELAKKLLLKWFEYLLKVLNWLFYLIYDIVVLGFSILYERLSQYYTCGYAYAQQLRKDLKQNSNKPSTWIKNYWRRFDARFKKNSKWAFWRRFYKKKQPEVSADFYKNGRLPQTGEEAMYSLLNCKGKDAYSILGVPSDSSQEQIRKHYKKIAVLVHPDKNKQAGAEEAFKVLQRAFELIGEPENREAYDRSLVEALHAEKAWTELHDLLSQLQTKITEAANTIRCSTCGLRHPRKLNDRPHYAARECASCKIRHSAREGDIWAETTMMGLRWKYLALMDGKVFDITEWANCQKGALSHLEPNSHMVQYRIVRGAQQQQQANQQSHGNHTHPQYQTPHSQGGSKYKRDIPPSEASLHEFLDNLYSGQHRNGQPNPNAFSGSTKKRTRRN